MLVALLFLLMSSATILTEELPCCYIQANSIFTANGTDKRCLQDMPRYICEQTITRLFTFLSRAGYQTVGLYVAPTFYSFFKIGEKIGSKSMTHVTLFNNNITSLSLNQIADISYFIALGLQGDSRILIKYSRDCKFLRNVQLLHFDSMKDSEGAIHFLRICKKYFESVAFLRLNNISFYDNIYLYLPSFFPTLQMLFSTICNLSIPLRFPHYNSGTRTIPLNLTWQELYNQLTGSSYKISALETTLPTNKYSRMYSLDYNPNINLEIYHFRGFVHCISLVGCQIAHLRDDILSNVTGLQYLYLQNNNIVSLPETLFITLTDLKILDMSFNRITNLFSNLFIRQSELVVLSLSNNRLEQLEHNVFAELSNLKYVYLDNNSIYHIHQNTFTENNRKLKFISLKNNRISEFPHPLLYLPNIEILQLQGHHLSMVNFSEFFNDDSLNENIAKSILLKSNDLKKRTIDMSGGLTQILTIDPSISAWKRTYIFKYHNILLDNNPLSCYCDVIPLIRLVKQIANSENKMEKGYSFADWRCSQPQDLKGKLLLHLNMTEIYCPLNLTTCPSECKCYKRYKIGTHIVDCRGTNLTETPSVLPSGKTELLLTGNMIEHFKMSISQCASIVKLEIQDNKLKSFDSNCIASMKYLKVLYLNNNLISNMPNVIQNLESLDEIQLGNNPYTCDCNSLWFKSWLIRKKNIINDYTEVKCTNIGDDTGHTIYNVPDKNFICKKAHSNTVTSVIASVASVSFMCLLSMLLLYINWHRFKVCLYIHTGMHPFDKADDDDLMPYDALVVYVSESEWVNTNIITPITEEHGYKLMDCEKDFKFGVDQDRNIQDGVSRSKRLLLVITPDSLSERLVRRTIEDALEKCKTQTSNFIIPIFHNCSPADCKDKHLNRFIKSGMFVSTQHQYFLRRILYYMPKKRLKQLGVHYKNERNSNGRLELSNPLDELFQQRLQMKSTSSDDSSAIDSESNLTNRASSIVACSDDSIGITRPLTSQHAVEIHYMSCPELVIERPSPEGSVVFVWYADDDFQFMMNEIVRPLEEYGHTFILADKSFIPGASNQENILNAIERSSRTIIILSKESIVDELLLYTFRFASERHMSDDHYMMGLIVRGDVEELDCDEEVKKHLLRYTPLSDTDEWFLGKLRAFVKQHSVMNSRI